MSGGTQSSANAKKKALIMTMGNTRDIRGLVDLLADETDDEIKGHIITVLAAMGSAHSQIIDIFQKHLLIEQSSTIRNRIQQALDVISEMGGYTTPS